MTIHIHPTACNLPALLELEQATGLKAVVNGRLAVLVSVEKTAPTPLPLRAFAQ